MDMFTTSTFGSRFQTQILFPAIIVLSVALLAIILVVTHERPVFLIAVMLGVAQILMVVMLEVARRDIHTKQQFIEGILTNLPGNFSFLDTRLRYRWANTRRSSGTIPAEQLVGRRITDIMPPRYREEIVRVYQGVLDTGVPYKGYSIPFSFEDKPPVYLDLVVVPVRDLGNRICGVLSVTFDVTDRVELERKVIERSDDLMRANQRLKELDRLKSDFVNTVSHELRTPLTTISGYAEFLEDELGGPLSEQQHEFVRQIQEGVRRQVLIVDDLLDFARMEAGTFKLAKQKVDLAGLVADEVSALMPAALEANIHLHAEVDADVIPVWADYGRIGQVIRNLINNALKFTHPGGEVIVWTIKYPDRVKVIVQDNGIGIPEDKLPVLFDRFFQVDPTTTREKGGAGLGLSISKALIEAHGGEIGVDSTFGQGSSFWFILPRDLPPNV